MCLRHLANNIRNWAGWVGLLNLYPMTNDSHDTGLRRARCASRLHKFPHLSSRNPIPRRRGTHERRVVVEKGMWMSTLSVWVMSVQTLIIILFCIQDFDSIIAGTYANNWAEYLVQLVGPSGAVAILSLLWVDSTCATASCFMSAQRVTYAISRDGILPGSKYFRKLSKKNHMPVNA